MRKTKTIELIEVRDNLCLDTLYANEAYEDPFVIETKCGSLHRVTLIWKQGRGQNYFFCDGDEYSGHATYIYPTDVAYIEVRKK